MTRDEALHKHFSSLHNKQNNLTINDLINEIYDDFEDEICINCKFFKPSSKYEFAECSQGIFANEELADNCENTYFGCNKFEKK